MAEHTVGIVGTGPAALMAGTVLAEGGWTVHFFDQKKAPARKFLVAGHGGFNLTNAEPIEDFVLKYDSPTIQQAVRQFTNQDYIAFLHKIGIPTYAGTSGKIFPKKGIKPIDVLQKWIDHLEQLQAQFHYECRMVDFDLQQLSFVQNEKTESFHFDAVVFALGGASWPVTGSDGNWLRLFQSKGIPTKPFAASNSGMELPTTYLISEKEGQWMKNIRLYSDRMQKKGDLVLTKYGIEGPTVYALNRDYRSGNIIYADFKPELEEAVLVKKLQSASNHSEGLRQLKINAIARHWLRLHLDKMEFLSVEKLIKAIKQFPLPVIALRPIEEVISTVGGISIHAVSPDFELQHFPHHYCVGEMLNWDAPTGGYLIQAAVSSGYVAARNILKKEKS